MLWHTIISLFCLVLFLFTLKKKIKNWLKQPLDYYAYCNMAVFFFKEICEQELRVYVIQRIFEQ